MRLLLRSAAILLVLFAGGRALAEPETEDPAPAEVLSWLRRQAVALKTVEAGHGFADLRPIKSLVGSARIVALGEATHGTREFFQVKHRLLEFLATEMGFTIFAMEAGWPESLAIDDYVIHGTGDPARALAGLGLPILNTEEIVEMVRWMRRYNADPVHLRKLHFFGFDMQLPFVAANRAFDYLQRVDPEVAKTATGILGQFQRPGETRRGDYPAEVAAGLRELLRLFHEKKSVFVSRSSEEEWAEAEHHLRIVAQFEENIRRRGAGRDDFQAENVRWLLREGGKDARMVLWAQNGHIATDSPIPPRPMGAYLKEALPGEYLAIGLMFHRGSFQASPPSGGLRAFTVGPGPDGSLDSTLARAGIPLYLVAFNRLPPEGPIREWWHRPHRSRLIGWAYNDLNTGNWVEVVPAESFDAILFVESTTAAKKNPSPGS